MEQEISRKIRETRKALGITLKELSEKTQLSISFLSQVERGVCSMTLTSLKKIADALGIPIGSLLDIGEQASFVNRKDNEIILDLERSYVRYVPLSSKFDNRKLEGLLLTMEPHYCEQEVMVHNGEEFYYIMSGTATFIIDGKEFEVEEGEVIHFPSTLPHQTINRQSCELKMLCVTTPAIF